MYLTNINILYNASYGGGKNFQEEILFWVKILRILIICYVYNFYSTLDITGEAHVL